MNEEGGLEKQAQAYERQITVMMAIAALMAVLALAALGLYCRRVPRRKGRCPGDQA